MPSRRHPHTLLLVVLPIAITFVGPINTVAQSTTAACLPSFAWMNNSLNQNPCLIGAYLIAACSGGDFVIGALAPNYYYGGPTSETQNPCLCSSLTYTLLSGCGLCQNHTNIVSWTSWSANCSTAYPGVYLPGIPNGTAVPQWAYQDVSTTDMFNIKLAQSVGDTPESSATLAQSTTSSRSATFTGSVVPSLTPSPSVAAQLSSSHAPSKGETDGIVAGVVVVAVLVIGVAVFWIRKRNSSPKYQRAQGAVFTDPTPFGLEDENY